MVNPMEHLLGAQLGRFFIELRFFKQLPNLKMAQPHEVNASVTARRYRARRNYRVDMARNLHDDGAYNCVDLEKPALRPKHYV